MRGHASPPVHESRSRRDLTEDLQERRPEPFFREGIGLLRGQILRDRPQMLLQRLEPAVEEHVHGVLRLAQVSGYLGDWLVLAKAHEDGGSLVVGQPGEGRCHGGSCLADAQLAAGGRLVGGNCGKQVGVGGLARGGRGE